MRCQRRSRGVPAQEASVSEKGRSSPLGQMSYLGQSVPRLGAKAAVAGRGRYTDDIQLPRMLHAAFVRSPYAHARIVDIDLAAARRHEGIHLVLTGRELAQRVTGPWVGTLSCFAGMRVLSARIEPPDRVEVGSTASTATRWPASIRLTPS